MYNSLSEVGEIFKEFEKEKEKDKKVDQDIIKKSSMNQNEMEAQIYDFSFDNDLLNDFHYDEF